MKRKTTQTNATKIDIVVLLLPVCFFAAIQGPAQGTQLPGYQTLSWRRETCCFRKKRERESRQKCSPLVSGALCTTLLIAADVAGKDAPHSRASQTLPRLLMAVLVAANVRQEDGDGRSNAAAAGRIVPQHPSPPPLLSLVLGVFLIRETSKYQSATRVTSNNNENYRKTRPIRTKKRREKETKRGVRLLARTADVAIVVVDAPPTTYSTAALLRTAQHSSRPGRSGTCQGSTRSWLTVRQGPS